MARLAGQMARSVRSGSDSWCHSAIRTIRIIQAMVRWLTIILGVGCFLVLDSTRGATLWQGQGVPHQGVPQQGVPQLDVPQQWMRRTWTTEHGLPQNSVNAIEQSRSGFLWLATYDGLARFDGHAFTTFRHDSNRMTSVHEDANGRLWVGTESGLLVLENGILQPAAPPSGFLGSGKFHINRITGGPDGGLFVSATALAEADAAEAGLYALTDSVWQLLTPPASMLGGRHVYTVDTAGRVFVEHTSIVYEVGSTFHAHSMPFTDEEDSIRFLEPGTRTLAVADSSVWLGTRFGVVAERRGSSFNVIAQIPAPAQGFDAYLPGDSRGRVWTASADGYSAWRLEPTAQDGPYPYEAVLLVHVSRDEGASAQVRTLFEADDGTIWAGTNGGGLERLRLAEFATVGKESGLENDIMLSVTQARDGSVWAGTNCGGVYRIARASDNQNNPLEAEPVRDAHLKADACVHAVLGDREGGVWIGADALYYHEPGPPGRPGRTTRFDQQQGLVPNPGARSDFVLALLQEADTLWVGTQTGLHAFVNGQFTWHWNIGSSNVRAGPVQAIYRRRDGRLVVGLRTGMVIFERDMATWEELDLPGHNIRSFIDRPNGTLWIGTYGAGLLSWDGATFKRLTSDDGLPENVVSTMVEMDGWLWLSGNRGITRVRSGEVDDWFAGRTSSVRAVLYAEESGLLNAETNGGFQPGVLVDASGNIWYPTLAGLARVDPNALAPEEKAPRVHVTGIESRGEARPDGLESGERTFSIRYTAIALDRPENVQFEFRLVPYDTVWTAAGSRRQAFFTGVGAGQHTFEVRAAGASGGWSPSARFVLDIPYFWWERTWVHVGVLLILTGLVAGAVRARLQAGERRRRELQALVDKRTNQLQQALDELRERDAFKTRFFQNASHDLRTPLSLMLAPVEELLQTADSSQKPLLELMQRNGERLLDLISEQLEIARFEASPPELRRAFIDPVELVRSQVALFESGARVKDIDLSFENAFQSEGAPDPTPLLYADGGRLVRVFSNVIGNAVKYTPKGGSIRVRMEPWGTARLAVIVEDTGPGFPEHLLEHVFERYARGGDSRAGSGIGLAVCREFVRTHGGDIHVKNRENGAGACVRIVLPLASPSDEAREQEEGLVQEAERMQEAELMQADARPETRILVVDDNPDMRMLLGRTLREFDVSWAATGGEALEEASDMVPDVIVSDVMMPGMDGFALCRALRDDVATSHIPVILLTARADRESLLEGFRAGADQYVFKPFRTDELRARIESVLAQRERLREAWAGQQRGAAVSDARVGATSYADLNLAPRERAFVERVHEVIAEHMERSSFGVDDLASEVFLSRRQLSRKLVALTGDSPGQIIRRARLARAAELLTDGHTVQMAAAAVGYRSATHFSQAFREEYGMPPSEWPV